MARKNAIGWMLTIALGTVVLVSCTLLEGFRAKREEARGSGVFPHKPHTDLPCTNCHAKARSEAQAGRPALKTCTDCHSEPAKGSRVEKALLELQAREEAGKPLWRPRAASDLLFHHGEHLRDVTYVLPSGQKKPLSCDDCHGEVARSEDLPKKTLPPMDLCMDCHERGKPAEGEGEEPTSGETLTACSFCHERIRRDVKPPDHRGVWHEGHGEALRFGLTKEESRRCAACHRKDFCTDCHMQKMPRSHNRLFRLRAHGIDAGLSRERCATCHLEDFCIRCHTSKRPLNHSGSWGGMPYRHCQACHLPLSMTRCAVCHKATEHRLAPLIPADATHAGTCTMSCHTRQHHDPGPVCTACHK